MQSFFMRTKTVIRLRGHTCQKVYFPTLLFTHIAQRTKRAFFAFCGQRRSRSASAPVQSNLGISVRLCILQYPLTLLADNEGPDRPAHWNSSCVAPHMPSRQESHIYPHFSYTFILLPYETEQIDSLLSHAWLHMQGHLSRHLQRN